MKRKKPAPSAGGRLTKKRIDPAEVIMSVADGGAGATVLFLGAVRDSSEAGKVEMMAYEAYEPMAERKLLEVEEEVRRLWPSTKKVKILHRVGGMLAVGDISVAIAVSSAHRAEAFEACRHAIERVKRDVPIWKKETLADGRSAWVAGDRMGRGKGARRGRSGARIRPPR